MLMLFKASLVSVSKALKVLILFLLPCEIKIKIGKLVWLHFSVLCERVLKSNIKKNRDKTVDCDFA